MADPFKTILDSIPDDGPDGSYFEPQSSDPNEPLTERQLDWAFKGLTAAYRAEMDIRRKTPARPRGPISATPFKFREPETIVARGLCFPEGMIPELGATRFFAWHIGNAVLNLIGVAALHELYEAFAAHYEDTHPGAWLCSAWSGVSNGRYIWPH